VVISINTAACEAARMGPDDVNEKKTRRGSGVMPVLAASVRNG